RARPPPPTRGAEAGSDRRCPAGEGARPIARVTARAGAPAPLPAGYRPRMENFAAGVRSICNSPAQVIP
ncbi:unnamed protein product, partial [Gulo gulo]